MTEIFWTKSDKRILRINAITKHLKTCKDCNFAYIPMSKRTEKECPKCIPKSVSTYSDETYLSSEEITEESITNESLFDNAPKFSQNEFSNLTKRE